MIAKCSMKYSNSIVGRNLRWVNTFGDLSPRALIISQCGLTFMVHELSITRQQRRFMNGIFKNIFQNEIPIDSSVTDLTVGVESIPETVLEEIKYPFQYNKKDNDSLFLHCELTSYEIIKIFHQKFKNSNYKLIYYAIARLLKTDSKEEYTKIVQTLLKLEGSLGIFSLLEAIKILDSILQKTSEFINISESDPNSSLINFNQALGSYAKILCNDQDKLINSVEGVSKFYFVIENRILEILNNIRDLLPQLFGEGVSQDNLSKIFDLFSGIFNFIFGEDCELKYYYKFSQIDTLVVILNYCENYPEVDGVENLRADLINQILILLLENVRNLSLTSNDSVITNINQQFTSKSLRNLLLFYDSTLAYRFPEGLKFIIPEVFSTLTGSLNVPIFLVERLILLNVWRNEKELHKESLSLDKLTIKLLEIPSLSIFGVHESLTQLLYHREIKLTDELKNFIITYLNNLDLSDSYVFVNPFRSYENILGILSIDATLQF